jgi:formate hydrogenlyase subunit 3/multisubunit Na+/H+ antiporter MnhD subunit
MTLALLLALGSLTAAGTGWALARDDGLARLGAVGGVLALILVGVLAVASPTPATTLPDAAGAVPGTLWNGALVPGAYLRVVIALWSATSVLLALVAWLLRGVTGLRGLLPATLAALVGATVALAAATPALAAIAAAATGLASIPAVLASPRGSAAAIAAREVRVAVATGLVVFSVAAIVPVLARLILANPDGPVTAAGSGETAVLAFGLLAMALVVAARVGAIPWHVRVSALTDTVPAGALPLVIAWLPLPLAAVAVGVASGVIAPLMPQIGPARALIVALTLFAVLAAALVAFVQDDLRHSVGYLTIADLALVVLAMAALDPAVWGPARVWLLTAAVTKSALAAWAGVVEDRFESRSLPELRGWLRPSPLLGLGLVLIVIATIGLPGSAVMTARFELVGRGASGPWDALLLVASLLTLPAYVRWLWLGIAAPTSHVDRAAPEFASLGRLPSRRLSAKAPANGLPVEQEGVDAGSTPVPVAPSAAAASPAAAPRSTAASRPQVRAGTGIGTRGRPVRRTDAAASAMSSAAAPAAQLELPAVEPLADDAPLARRRTRAASGSSSTAQAAETIKRHRAGLLSGAVLALALLATLVAFGGFDVAHASCEPTPAVAGVEGLCR